MLKNSLKLKCKNCGKKFEKRISQINNPHNSFCSRKCWKINWTKKIILKCSYCNQKFKRYPSQVKFNKIHNKENFCSHLCLSKSRQNRITYKCEQCGQEKTKRLGEYNKGVHHFCGRSCAAKYGNTHNKKSGNNRSKLEVWLEEKLLNLYPKLEFLFNNRETINAELDIYIPSIKLAFELNGPTHYEPIYGLEELKKKQNNDDRKFQACLENNIELAIIDVSKIKHLKEQKALEILKYIQDIINLKL